MFNKKLRKQIENLKEKNLKYHAEYFNHTETISFQTRQIREMKNENLRLKEKNRELEFLVTENEHLRRVLEDARKSMEFYRNEFCAISAQRDRLKYELIKLTKSDTAGVTYKRVECTSVDDFSEAYEAAGGKENV